MNLPYYVTWCAQNNATTFNIKSVDGVKLIIDDNKEIIDMTSISYQAHFGYNHPSIIKHIKNQLDTIPMSSPKAIIPGKNETTEKLLEYLGLEEGKIFYTTSGAESVENALKIARDVTKKKIILARKNSYHGATLGALTVTGDWRNPAHITPSDWVVRIPEPNEVDSIKKIRNLIIEHRAYNIAAIILETITGGNGVISATDEWWQQIRSICDEFNILLILDEVVCGFERTGKPFGFHHYNLKPDIVCMAKGISGGMIPFGAVWTNNSISNYYDKNILCCGLTNYAHPLGLAALNGVLEITSDQNFILNLRDIETIFLDELNKLKEIKIVKEIRTQGMLCALDLYKTIDSKNFLENGIYLVSQKDRIILAPPLIIDKDTLKIGMSKIGKVLKDNL
jgi:taurine--2-oxoglutarate transaminase